MAVTASAVKELRERTGAGMLDCKKRWMKQMVISTKRSQYFAKRFVSRTNKAGRIATEGVVESYIHGGGRIGVLVEINCETDFVGKTDQFKEFARDIAMHCGLTLNMFVVKKCRLKILRKKRDFENQALNEGKPEKSLRKWLKAASTNTMKNIACLSNPSSKILTKRSTRANEKSARSVRTSPSVVLPVLNLAKAWRKQDNFVEEVMSQVNK